MKKNITVILFIILAGFVLYSVFSKKAAQQTPVPIASTPTPISTPISTPTINPTSTQSSSCAPSDFQANITIDHAAGNVYGMLTLKNTSGKACQINGNAFIQPVFTAQNISVSQQGQPGPTVLTLSPNQNVYSQVHYPNGPQCQSGIQQETISFTYQISANKVITFKDQNGEAKQSIVACKSLSEKTDVQVWSLAEKPIN